MQSLSSPTCERTVSRQGLPSWILQVRVLGWVAAISPGIALIQWIVRISCQQDFLYGLSHQAYTGKAGKTSRKVVRTVDNSYRMGADWIIAFNGRTDIHHPVHLKYSFIITLPCFLQMKLSEHLHKPLWAPVLYMSGGSHCIICEDSQWLS